MTKVFVEQPLALPGSANNSNYTISDDLRLPGKLTIGEGRQDKAKGMHFNSAHIFQSFIREDGGDVRALYRMVYCRKEGDGGGDQGVLGDSWSLDGASQGRAVRLRGGQPDDTRTH